VVHHGSEGIVHGFSVLGHNLELLDINLLQERVDLDTLHQVNDLGVQLCVLGIQNLVVLLQGIVVGIHLF